MTVDARIQQLMSHPGPLFGLLDAAQSPAVLALLKLHPSPFVSLYAGRSAKELEAVAPYLVDLTTQRAVIAPLLTEGAGKHWGVFFSAGGTLADLRTHFRKYLLAELPTGQTVVFRFYDPRVLLPFLHGSQAAERLEFLGGIQQLWLEQGEDWIESTSLG